MMHKGLSARVMKAMGIFSGVQFAGILASMVRTKCVALWIGSAGVGLLSLYYSAFEMLSTLTQLGIRNSSVRDLTSTNSQSALSRMSYVVRRWSLALGALGTLLTMAFSPLLSLVTFGDYDHTLGFILLSIMLFFTAVTNGEYAVLQGAGQLKRLATATIVGVVGSVAIVLPIYYFWGIDGIIPSLIITSAVMFVSVLLMRHPVSKPSVRVSRKECFDAGRGFVKLGIFMTISTFISFAVSYIFKVYLNNCSNVETVGLYQAGFTIVNQYVGVVFLAISMEYFPRLSKVSRSNQRTSLFVSHEAMLAMWIILPVAILMMGFDTLVLKIFYDSTFEATATFITWGIAGTAFRAFSWCMSYVIIARGDGKIFVLTELAGGTVSLTFNIIGFNIGGLTGLGISYLLSYIVYTAIVAAVYFRHYHLRINQRVVTLFAATALTAPLCAFLRSNFEPWIVVAIGILAAIVSLYALCKILRGRPDFRSLKS